MTIDPTKHGYFLPVSRELVDHGKLVRREIGIQLGIVQLSDEERAEREQRRQQYLERAKVYEAAVDALAARLAEVTEPLARAILDLHSSRYRECQACDESGWPCATVEVVAEHLGIPVPDEHEIVLRQ